MVEEENGKPRQGAQRLKLPSPAELLELATNLYQRAKSDLDANILSHDYDYLQEYQRLVLMSKATSRDDAVIYGLPVKVPDHYGGIPGILPGTATVNPRAVLSWVASQTQQLQTRLAHIVGEPGKAEAEPLKLDLGFIRDERIREVVALDFAEAQRALAAGAPKAAAILCGSVIEGMLLDRLNRQEVLDDKRTTEFFAAQDKRRYLKDEHPNWDNIPLRVLYEWAETLSLLRPAALSLAKSLGDFRNTVHPRAEIRDQNRAHLKEAAILLEVVQLIAADLGGQAPSPNPEASN